MAPGPSTALGLLAGWAVDQFLGDPGRGHPVAAFGRLAGAAERRWYADSRAQGVLVTVGTTAAVVGPAAGLASRARRVPSLDAVAVAAATWAVLGAASLARAGRALADALDRDDVAGARRVLPTLCGRDPDCLDAVGLARAGVESVAENTSDAVVAPLLWGAIAGVPGLIGYRAVNTLDAMIGHRSRRYERFGWAAARLDDAANWVPARVTALACAALAPVAGGSGAATWATMRRDGARHPSPNAGRVEAAFAGALGVRLGGRTVYGERIEMRGPLGDGRDPDGADLRRAVRLSRAVGAGAAVLAGVVALGIARAAR